MDASRSRPFAINSLHRTLCNLIAFAYLAYRHQGYGTKLLHYLEMRGVQEGALQSVLSAEIDACAFYESCGYQKHLNPMLKMAYCV